MIHLNPYTGPLLITAGAALLALVATLACTVLALRLGKVSRERDRHAHRLKAEAAAREAMARRAEKVYLRTARPIMRPGWSDAELGAIVRSLPKIRIPAREDS